jgi:uncharacterized membrane protein YoaK (UPF0700 family)
MSTQQQERLLTAILGWVAGYVDTLGFLGLNGLFTAHVTGNLIVAGAEVVGTGEDAVWVRLAVIPVFMIAVVCTVAYWRSRRCQPSSLLWFEALFLLIFLGVSVVLIPQPQQPIPEWTLFIVGSAGIFAMGIQNALMKEAFGTLAPTTVMTGNLTQFVIDLSQLMGLCHPEGAEKQPPSREALKKRMLKFGNALVGFVVGAATGALGLVMVGFWAIALPTVTIALLAVSLQTRPQLVQLPKK